MQLLNTTHNHKSHRDHKIDPQDKPRKKNLFDDLRIQDRKVILDILFQINEPLSHL